MVPTVGNMAPMTLKEYIESGGHSITQIGQHFGISEHGVKKWVYRLRAPDITTALAIEALTGGKVTVPELQRLKDRAA